MTQLDLGRSQVTGPEWMDYKDHNLPRSKAPNMDEGHPFSTAESRASLLTPLVHKTQAREHVWRWQPRQGEIRLYLLSTISN